MKILFAHCGVFEKRGWGRTYPLAEGLVRLGNDVTIITTNPNYSVLVKSKKINNIRIVIFPDIVPPKITNKGYGFISLILKILYVTFNKFEVVHSDIGHRPQSGMPCRISKKLHKSKYISEWWDWWGVGGEYDLQKKLFKKLLGGYELKYEIKDKQFADGIVVLSDVLYKRALSLKPPEKIIKLHGGADVTNIPYIDDNTSLKEKYGIDKSLVTFGYIDAYNQDFNEIQPMLDSIFQLQLETKVKLLIFGRTRFFENGYSEEYKNLIVDFGWVNFSKDYEKLQCVDVFVLFKVDSLSNRAGWPNCIGDYLACGRPVLLNPVGEMTEFVNKYPEGFFISSLSTESVSDRVKFIMEHHSLLREKGKINRAVAENEISWYRKSDTLNEFYKSIISG
jgi:glycosyltransferase involved in cell wall biosynthesis